MNTIFLILLGTVVVATMSFLLLLFRLPLKDADLWLKALSGVVAAFTFVAGVSALITGHIVNEQQGEKVLALERGNLELQSQVEGERRTRIELEKSVAPRVIALTLNGDKTNIDSLKPFAGMKAVIEFLPDAEPRRAASNLAFLLQTSGWNIVGMVARPELAEPFFDGVVITAAVGRRREADKAREATDALIAFLKVNNWDARRFPAHKRDLDINEVKIQVGFKSSPYLLPKEIKDSLREIEQFQERIRKQNEDNLKERLERNRRLEEEIEKRRQKPE